MTKRILPPLHLNTKRQDAMPLYKPTELLEFLESIGVAPKSHFLKTSSSTETSLGKL